MKPMVSFATIGIDPSPIVPSYVTFFLLLSHPLYSLHLFHTDYLNPISHCPGHI